MSAGGEQLPTTAPSAFPASALGSPPASLVPPAPAVPTLEPPLPAVPCPPTPPPPSPPAPETLASEEQPPTSNRMTMPSERRFECTMMLFGHHTTEVGRQRLAVL